MCHLSQESFGKDLGLNADVESKYNIPVCSSLSILNQLPLAHLSDLCSSLLDLPTSIDLNRTEFLNDIQFYPGFILKDQINKPVNAISV